MKREQKKYEDLTITDDFMKSNAPPRAVQEAAGDHSGCQDQESGISG